MKHFPQDLNIESQWEWLQRNTPNHASRDETMKACYIFGLKVMYGRFLFAEEHGSEDDFSQLLREISDDLFAFAGPPPKVQ